MFAQDRDHGSHLVLRYSSGLAELGLGTREVSQRFVHYLKYPKTVSARLENGFHQHGTS
jgi:hypothetical protein